MLGNKNYFIDIYWEKMSNFFNSKISSRRILMFEKSVRVIYK